GILSIEKDDVFIGLDNPHGRALPWESQRLARHDGIVLVRPLIEFLNLVPKLGFVNGTTRPKPRGRDPLIIHPEVVLPGFAADLRWTTPAGSTTRDWKRRGPPVSCHVRLPTGQPRRCDGCSLRRSRRVGRQSPVGRLIRWLDRRLDAGWNRH